MADPALGEAVLDRVLQAAHRITLKGPSMRKRQPPAETCRETSPSEHHLDPQATRSDPQVRAPRASEPIRRPTLPGEHDAPIVCHEEATTEPQTH